MGLVAGLTKPRRRQGGRREQHCRQNRALLLAAWRSAPQRCRGMPRLDAGAKPNAASF
jgi:hypothetical protein